MNTGYSSNEQESLKTSADHQHQHITHQTRNTTVNVDIRQLSTHPPISCLRKLCNWQWHSDKLQTKIPHWMHRSSATHLMTSFSYISHQSTVVSNSSDATVHYTNTENNGAQVCLAVLRTYWQRV